MNFGNRMNCNLIKAIKYKYVKNLLRYCKAWGFKYMFIDTVLNRR